MAKELRFTIVVCAYNSADYIESTLRSLIHLDYPNNMYEIIVVNDCSQDNTGKVVRRFKRVKLINHSVNKGVSCTRNTGLMAASGRWLAFIDDDCVADKRWLNELEQSLKQSRVIGAGGLILPSDTRHFLQRYLFWSGYGRPASMSEGRAKSSFERLIAYGKSQFAHASGNMEARKVFEVYGANSAFRTQKLQQIGGFDSSLRSSEDSDICRRLQEQFPDNTIWFNLDAIVYHRYEMSLVGYITKLFRRQKDTLNYYTQQKKIPPLYPMPCIFGLLLIASFWASWQLALSVLVIAPLILYCWWTVRAVHSARPELLLYPYVQLIEEGARISGLLVASLRMRSS